MEPKKKTWYTWNPKHPGAIVAVLLFVMFLISFLSSVGTLPFGGSQPPDSGIVDEIAHIPAGYSYLKYGDYRLNPEHPPLIKDLAALPLLFVKDIDFPDDIPAWTDEINGQWQTGWTFIYERGNDPEMIFRFTRFLPMLLLFLLGIYVYRWAKELFGVKAGLLATLLYAFCPNIIAHSHYVTTDFGVTVFMFISVYYFTKFIKRPGWVTMLAATVSFALASLAKFSAVTLIPFFILLALSAVIVRREQIKNWLGSLRLKTQGGKRFWIYTVGLLLIFVLGHLLIMIPYVHHTWNMPLETHARLIDESLPQQTAITSLSRSALHALDQIPGGKAFGTYALGALMVFARVGGGNSAFLMGDYQNEGWWHYYLDAFVLKTPIPTMIFCVIALVLALVMLRRNWPKLTPGYQIDGPGGPMNSLDYKKLPSRARLRWEKFCKLIWLRWDIFTMLALIAMFLVLGVRSKANIGLRWMLPIYPFMFVLLGGAVLFWLRNLRRQAIEMKKEGKLKIATGLVIILLVWYVGGAFLAYPYYLSYFNELIGSKHNAYLYLVDSNLDWGQDLNRLARWVDYNEIDHLYVDYFGGGVPKQAIGADKVTSWHSKMGLPPSGSYLAVSATFYQMSEFYARRSNEVSYVRMLPRKPDFQIDSSILIYKITEQDQEQFIKAGTAIEKAAQYLGREVTAGEVKAEQQVVENTSPNTMKIFPPDLERPCYTVWFTERDGDQRAVYVDRLTGEIWGGYEVSK